MSTPYFFNLQCNRPNPAKPSVVKRNGIWLARVDHPTEGHLVDGAYDLPEAFAKAVNYAAMVTQAAA